MADVLSLAAANFLSPPVLFFALGAAAGFARSDLALPDQVAKGLSLYLLLAIGFKGGVAAQASGLDREFLAALGLGLALACLMPFVAFATVRLAGKLDRVNAAAVAAHYGSISIVTFVAATEFARLAGLEPGQHLAAVAAAMETPGIVAALFLAARGGEGEGGARPAFNAHLAREVLLNGSVVVLVGAFAIGLVTGARGMERLDLFVNGLFQGALALFLLEMGLVAARRLMSKARLNAGLIAAGVALPFVGAGLALAGAAALGIGADDGMVLMTLAASASYIAAPAAIRIALPEADPGVYLPLSLGVTFPFNIVVGVPLYAASAQAVLG